MADKVKLTPNVFSYPDYEHSELHMEISLGGVKKEDITLKMHTNGFYLHAPRDDFEYVTSMALCCPVEASESKATLENGILKVVVPYKDRTTDGVQVQIV